MKEKVEQLRSSGYPLPLLIQLLKSIHGKVSLRASSLKILQQIRDEAHRFAVTYHRKKRKKRTLASSLDQIPGIGPKRRAKLLIKFGSIKNIRKCGIEILIKEGELSERVARAIYTHFHPEENKSE